MKSIFIIIGIFFSISAVHAQSQAEAWMSDYGTLDGFVVDSQYFTMVTDANLRDKPGTQSKVMTKLPIGTKLTVVEVSETTYSQRGVTLPWVKVRASLASGTLEGYLWGGFLALARIQTPDEEYMPNRGVLYMTGVSAYDSTKHEITVGSPGTELEFAL